MDAKDVKEKIKETRFLPILRTNKNEILKEITRVVYESGVRVFEFTMTIPGILDVIPEIKQTYPDMILGLGTVLNKEDAVKAMENGVDFIVSPVLKEDLADVVKSKNKLLMLAGLTPTEIYKAYDLGSDIVKIFPASAIEPDFISSLKGPLPFIDVLPTGGVSLIRGMQFLKAGAIAFGMGGPIFRKDLINSNAFDKIQDNILNIKKRLSK